MCIFSLFHSNRSIKFRHKETARPRRILTGGEIETLFNHNKLTGYQLSQPNHLPLSLF